MSKARLSAEADRLGAALDFEEQHVLAWAPEGHCWVESQTHALSQQFSNGMQSWKPSAFKELRERMAEGTQPCNCQDCQ